MQVWPVLAALQLSATNVRGMLLRHRNNEGVESQIHCIIRSGRLKRQRREISSKQIVRAMCR